MKLSPKEVLRYSRHLNLPQVAESGQLALKKAKVLVIGAGGLGSPIALYLAAAGVGQIGLVDDDRVDESNLQRQVLFGNSQVGEPKVSAAQARLSDLNPEIEIQIHQTRLSAENAMDVISNYHLVADGTDNFATRYLLNDACSPLPSLWSPLRFLVSKVRSRSLIQPLDFRVTDVSIPNHHPLIWFQIAKRAVFWVCFRVF